MTRERPARREPPGGDGPNYRALFTELLEKQEQEGEEERSATATGSPARRPAPRPARTPQEGRDGRGQVERAGPTLRPAGSAATGDPARAGGRVVGGEPADGGVQRPGGVPPSEQREAEGKPAQERAGSGTERGSGDTTDRVNADDSAGRADSRTGTSAAGRRLQLPPQRRPPCRTRAARDARRCSPGRTGTELGHRVGRRAGSLVDHQRRGRAGRRPRRRGGADSDHVIQDERVSRLEQGCVQGEDVSSEDLRQALHRYRSFFERLLHV